MEWSQLQVYYVLQEGAAWFSAIVKLDVASGRAVAAWEPPNHFPGEPIFVPRPGSTAEDDGAVLSVVLNGEQLLCNLNSPKQNCVSAERASCVTTESDDKAAECTSPL